MEPLTVSVDEARRLTGLGRTTIFSLIETGRLESALVGRKRLVKLASIKRLVGAEQGE